MEEKCYVFVYGTLRMGQRNQHVLQNSVRGAAQCYTNGELYDSPYGYPFLKEDETGRVYGELYEADQELLIKLDDFEGYRGPGKNNHYNRTIKTVTTDIGTVQAFVYVLPEDGDRYKLQYIEGGDWSVYSLLKNKESFLYFAYASCMDDERFIRSGVKHCFLNVEGRGILRGYKLRFVKKYSDGGRADIVEEGGIVEGKIYEITKEGLAYLFKREGVKKGCYRPIVLEPQLNGKKLMNVLSFTVVEKDSETSPPKSYLQEIFRGGSDVLSPEYLENLKKEISEKFGLQ
ncbi:gamma-glutamylcyclotransferase [Mesobacillus foraminis]|uniref:gamma-glutamylcyclotransferase n=1 Tax=Mesobacillus foraminis TaxID=279826 RepID=UPI0039A28ACF